MLPERAFRVNFFVLLLLGLAAAGCRTGLQDGVFSKKGVRYRVGSVPPGFRQVGFADNDLAFVNERTGHSMALNSTCRNYDDASLEVLTHHLLMGFTDVQTLAQEKVPLDGRDSLRTRVLAKLDGVPVEMLLVVMKRSGCVFDLTYLAPPGRYADALPAFNALLQQFTVEEP